MNVSGRAKGIALDDFKYSWLAEKMGKESLSFDNDDERG